MIYVSFHFLCDIKDSKFGTKEHIYGHDVLLRVQGTTPGQKHGFCLCGLNLGYSYLQG